MRVLRILGITALTLFCLLGLTWRVKLSDSGLAAHQAKVKKADISVSIAEEGHVIRVEGVQMPGQTTKPCSATLLFETSAQR